MDYNKIILSERKSITMTDFINHINRYIKNDDIQIIADIGSMDAIDASILYNSFKWAKTYAIEGLPSNYNSFIKNKTDIIGINAVIANYDGYCTYYEKDINGIHGIYNRGNQYGINTHKLSCYKLSTLMKNFDIPRFDIVKIDVEGATYDALLSLEDKISEIKIMHIETETSPFFEGQTLHKDVCDLLVKNNFEMIDITFVEILPNKYQSDSVWINKQYIN
jgi:FkbM family methyltransferase